MEGGSCLTLREHLPDPATHRIYFDFGTETLDALYRPTQTLVDDLMLAAGYEPDDNWMPRMFPARGILRPIGPGGCTSLLNLCFTRL